MTLPFQVNSRSCDGKPVPSWMYRWIGMGCFAFVVFHLGQIANAGCWLANDDGYRAFHHGQWFQSPETSLLGHDWRPVAATMAVSWVYEAGDFQPIAHPLSQPCQGPKCRSNPLDATWQTIPWTSETTRVSVSFADFSSESIIANSSRLHQLKDAEQSLRGFQDRLKRPPKI